MIFAADASPSTAFLSDFRAWRNARPAWKALLNAIRTDQPTDAILALTPDAGLLNRNELADLWNLARRARRDASAAKRLPATKKEMAAHDAAIADLEKKVAKETVVERHAELAGALQDAIAERECHHRTRYLDAEFAAKTIETAREFGVA